MTLERERDKMDPREQKPLLHYRKYSGLLARRSTVSLLFILLLRAGTVGPAPHKQHLEVVILVSCTCFFLEGFYYLVIIYTFLKDFIIILFPRKNKCCSRIYWYYSSVDFLRNVLLTMLGKNVAGGITLFSSEKMHAKE